MESRIAAVSIIIENPESVESLNNILHNYGRYIIGRMGIPYHKRSISIISLVMDAPTDIVNALTGKLGMLPDITAKAIYSKLVTHDEKGANT